MSGSTSDADFRPGLEGVIAFETEIAEPDKEGGALRYRGVDIDDLVGRVSFGNVWGLLVDNEFNPGLPPAEPFPLPVHTGDVRVDVQSALGHAGAGVGLPAAARHRRPSRPARTSPGPPSWRCRSSPSRPAASDLPMVPQREVDKARTIVERFMIRWRGEPDPRHVEAVDAYWVSAAEHGMNASTFTARVIASTGADVAACLSGAVGAMCGPLHGGAPSRVLHMIEDVERTGDADGLRRGRARPRRAADGLRPPRLPGRGPARPRAARARAERLGAPRFEVAAALEKAALDELHARRPDRVLATNVEFWAAVVLDFAEVPAHMFTPMFTCARTAGWSRAHPRAEADRPAGPAVRALRRPGPRRPEDVAGWDQASSSAPD